MLPSFHEIDQTVQALCRRIGSWRSIRSVTSATHSRRWSPKSPEQAKDAAERMVVNYESVPAVVDTSSAACPGQPAVWEEAPDNICFLFRLGDKKAAEGAFAKARHVVEETFRISRVIANPMETRAAIGLYDAAQGRYTLLSSLQAPHIIRDELARVLKVPASRLRVVSPDVGGAFGLKAGAFPELGLVLWTAKRTGRAVKWVCERSEAFLADHHARDNISRVRLALDDNCKFLALSVETTANVGAYIDSFGLHCPTNNLGGLAGPYAIGNFNVEVTVFSPIRTRPALTEVPDARRQVIVSSGSSISRRESSTFALWNCVEET